jgi:hypothetical protein
MKLLKTYVFKKGRMRQMCRYSATGWMIDKQIPSAVLSFLQEGWKRIPR